jgi:UrcA family protein
MDRRFASAAVTLAFAAANLLFGTPAGAQDTSRVGELTVTVPRPVERSSTGAPIETVTISRVINYRDLDLRTAAGAAELNKRIADAARSACRRLDQLYPVGTPNLEGCTKAAVDETASQVAAAMARPQG